MVTHRHVFAVVGYSTGMAVFTSVVSLIASFYWSYADVFVMLISIALASRFKLLNSCLKNVKGKVSDNSSDQMLIGFKEFTVI
jgi:gustatory receptor